jgi:hypothetical protein
MANSTRSLQCIVIGQSSQVDHVLVADQGGRPYALTKNRFTGDWSSLRRGDVVGITVTCEPLPQTQSGKLFAKRGSEAMNASAFESLVGTVLGIGTGTPYVLVECHDANQYVVNQRVFAGDWKALANGDLIALAVSGGASARVLSAWREVPPSTPTGDR